MKWFSRKKKVQSPAPEPESTFHVSVEEMNRFFPDRSAGRWCEHCQQHGTHHTDTHAFFVRHIQNELATAGE